MSALCFAIGRCLLISQVALFVPRLVLAIGRLSASMVALPRLCVFRVRMSNLLLLSYVGFCGAAVGCCNWTARFEIASVVLCESSLFHVVGGCLM